MAIFSAAEIVDMALEMERVGFKFYSALAENASNEETRTMFQWLAGEERVHEKEFEKLREGAGTYTLPESYPGEWQAYVQALIESLTILGDEEIHQIAKSANFVEALKIGVTLEKDTILFYEALKRYVPESQHKTVDEIIAQEQTHLRRLMGVLGELQK
ncbi:MAG: ferritin family protein [Armatimonadetes bacterium]|nr:ferritin family protein [Armatimonadota bacterium]MCX7967461.1 ferritin family protein [Armatimonadota bacterium]MDW8143741.1 ferritin family protein [Armatimonadota bacterium]